MPAARSSEQNKERLKSFWSFICGFVEQRSARAFVEVGWLPALAL